MDDGTTNRRGGASDDLATEFEALRPLLTRVAYGMLGSLAEAEDIVQEAWPRRRRGEALLLILERLSPAERTAFLLHDVFDLPFERVATVVGRSPAAVRQLAARARAHVEAGQPRFPAGGRRRA